METLDDIAYENGLELIETTPEYNGYPSSIKSAVIGFETFEEAEKLADKYGLSIEYFQRKDGWQLWYRLGVLANEAFDVTSDDFGDDYMMFTKHDLSTFRENEILPFLSEYSGEERIEFLKDKKEILDEVKKLKENEAVITNQGHYYATIKMKCMSYSVDTKHYAIGLIVKTNNI